MPKVNLTQAQDMARSKPPANHFLDHSALAIAGAYIIGMMVVGAAGVMVTGHSFRSLVSYKKTFASSGPFVDARTSTTNALVGKNILENPSFESPKVSGGAEMILPGKSAGFGWTVESAKGTDNFGVEVVASHDNVMASSGQQFVRLASKSGPAMLSQPLDSAPGRYELSFDYAAEPGTANAANVVEVRFNGQLLDTLSADGKGQESLKWQHKAYQVFLTGAGDSLEIKSKSKGGAGALVDNFVLVAAYLK